MEALIIKMVLLTQRISNVHYCVAEVHIGDGIYEHESRAEGSGGTGRLHLGK